MILSLLLFALLQCHQRLYHLWISLRTNNHDRFINSFNISIASKHWKKKLSSFILQQNQHSLPFFCDSKLLLVLLQNINDCFPSEHNYVIYILYFFTASSFRWNSNRQNRFSRSLSSNRARYTEICTIHYSLHSSVVDSNCYIWCFFSNNYSIYIGLRIDHGEKNQTLHKG